MTGSGPFNNPAVGRVAGHGAESLFSGPRPGERAIPVGVALAAAAHTPRSSDP